MSNGRVYVKTSCDQFNPSGLSNLYQITVRAASANSVESDLGCTSRVYFYNVTLTSQKPCQHHNKISVIAAKQ